MSCLQGSILAVIRKAEQLARLFMQVSVLTKLANQGEAEDRGVGGPSTGAEPG